jgi:hypothetical protein
LFNRLGPKLRLDVIYVLAKPRIPGCSIFVVIVDLLKLHRVVFFFDSGHPTPPPTSPTLQLASR